MSINSRHATTSRPNPLVTTVFPVASNPPTPTPWSPASRHLAGGTGRPAGAVDSGQLGVGGTAAGRRGRQDHQRQSLAGHLTGADRHPARTQNGPRATELGDAAGAADRPRGLDGLNLAGWGSLRLALPATGDSDASFLAAEAVAAASAPRVPRPPRAPARCSTLVAGQPKLANNSADEAMDTLAEERRPGVGAGARRRHHRTAALPARPSLPDAKSTLAFVAAARARRGRRLPRRCCSAATGSVEEQATAASEFARFLRKPEQLAELAKAGFRADGVKPPTSDVDRLRRAAGDAVGR